MAKRTTLSAITLVLLVTAACASPQAGLRSTATSSARGSAVATNLAPAAGSPLAQPPSAAPTQSRPIVPPSVVPNRCPPVTANPINANPVGCPGPLPPLPIVPQAGHARLLLCPQPIVAAAPPIAVGAVLCGAGFRPEELVTITVTGRTGSTSWRVAAGPDGSFRSMLAPAACRLLPAYLTARGNRGSVSNAVPLTMLACRGIR